jgi:outer membrane protein OmpA-like peptidoglycan-associated protein
MQKSIFLCVLLFSLCGFGQNKLEVFFDFNKDVPNEQSQIKLNQWISDNRNIEIIRVLGYCDSVDNNAYNKDLAMRRVNSMIVFFNKNNVKVSEKVELKSFGEEFKYSKIQSENRKVEVFYTILKDKKPAEKSNEKITAKPVERKKEKAVEKKAATTEVSEFEPADVEALVAEEKSTLATKFKKAKKGDLVRISNICFYLNSEKVTESSVPLLNELLQIMLDNSKMRIEIHGHICCNPNPMDTKLSYRRALVILKYLTNRGIEVGRLAFKGYGSNDPIYRVPERNEKERAANRRVEILIVGKE